MTPYESEKLGVTAGRKGSSPKGEKLVQAAQAMKCRRKFVHYFPKGFRDETYSDWERGYKWQAHESWVESLGRLEFEKLLKAKDFKEISLRAVRVESRTNLLFSFEKMALRDAVKSAEGAELFAAGLFDLLYGRAGTDKRFAGWCETVARLPRKQTRVLTWPLVTVFGFLGAPREFIFFKPIVTKVAAAEYGYPLHYNSTPSWDTYRELLGFAERIKQDLRDLKPRDMIDVQSFIWVQGSSEYPPLIPTSS